MSSREASISINTSKSNHTVRRIRKFKFTDLSVSYQVRRRLYEMLISFDDNVNYQFQKQQIKRALEQILDESPSEIAYVVRNVFRYDLNGDGSVTYQQFSNFCLEQHFGEVAIQRLHKNGMYSRGNERVMSREEFFRTLKYCLAFISISPNLEVMQKVFIDLDLDKDNFISYSDYFTFLKQYFGSQSQSAIYIKVNKVQEELKKTFGEVDKKKMKQQIFKQKLKKIQQQRSQKQSNYLKNQQSMLKQPQTKKSSFNRSQASLNYTANNQNILVFSSEMKSLCLLIARLIYQQVRISVINLDIKKKQQIDREVGGLCLRKIFQLSDKQTQQWLNGIFALQNSASYEQFIKLILEKYISQQEKLQEQNFPIKRESFVAAMSKKFKFLQIKHMKTIFEEVFEEFRKQKIQKQEFKSIVKMIMTSYEWIRKTNEIKGNLVEGKQKKNIVGY